jgi:hypothetical protein
VSEAPRGDAHERLTTLEEKLRALERELLDGIQASGGDRAARPSATAVAEPSRAESRPPPQQRPIPAPPADERARQPEPAPGPASSRRRRRPLVLLAAVLALAAGTALWLWAAPSTDDEETARDAPAVTGSAAGSAAPPQAFAAAGPVPPALRPVLPPGATIVRTASRRAALAAVCADRSDAAVLAAVPTTAARPTSAACALSVVAAVPTAATVLFAPRGGCVGPRRARRLAVAPGRLNARRERVAATASAAARRRLPDARPARRRAAGRRAAAAARARFDARNDLSAVAVRAPDGRCIAPTGDAIASGAYPLGRRATVVAATVDVPRVAEALRRPPPARPATRTVATGALS